MGENTTSKSFTLRDVTLTDIDKFTDLKNSKRLTPGGTLNLLLNAFENTGAPSVSTDELDKLKAANESLQKQLEAVNFQNTGLLEQIEALLNKTPETVEVPIKLKGTQFIFEPGKTLFDHMRRCMVYDIKKGVLKKSDPATQLFTDRALTYYIKNEYNHILK